MKAEKPSLCWHLGKVNSSSERPHSDNTGSVPRGILHISPRSHDERVSVPQSTDDFKARRATTSVAAQRQTRSVAASRRPLPLHHYSWWKTPALDTKAAARHSAERCMHDKPAASIEGCWGLGEVGAAGQARPRWSFSPLMEQEEGEVCRHVTKHTVCMISLLRGETQAMLRCRHIDSVLFGNTTCCTIKAFSI